MTLQEWVERGAAVLRTGPHPGRARSDAEVLLRHLLKQERAALLARWKERLDENEAQLYVQLLERRRTGEPIQYITGETEFYGLPFRVTPHVLIPRPETEHLVEAALALARGSQSARIVDVGTGSGAVAVTLAHALKSERITAIDISEAALAMARQNAVRNAVAVRFLQGDLLEPVAGETFDVVISNPPYVAEADASTLSVEVRDYEPHTALFAGADGLNVYRRLIPQAFSVLTPGGHLLLEIGYGQAEAVHDLLQSGGFVHLRSIGDLQGIPRVLEAMRGKD